MNLKKWLIRKYPKTGLEFYNFFGEDGILQMKEGKYRIGKLDQDFVVFGEVKYPIGTLFCFRNQKEYGENEYGEKGSWTGSYDQLGLFKCNKISKEDFGGENHKNGTISGYNTQWVSGFGNKMYQEIEK